MKLTISKWSGASLCCAISALLLGTLLYAASTGTSDIPVNERVKVTGRILSRNGRPPAPWEAGRKDVVRLGPDDQVRVFIQFRDFVGQYPMHCHNTVHEDHAMMARWVLSA